MPKISVLLPVYNGAKHIQTAVDSILNQTCADFELLILDGGSNDGTVDIIKQYTDKRIRLMTSDNRSLTKDLNMGLQVAKGDYIARMDADDISQPERFAKQIDFMQNNPDCVALGSSFDVIDDTGAFLFTYQSPYNSDAGYKWGILIHYMAHPSMMIRADIMHKIGGYRHYFDFKAEDRDLLYRLSNYGTLHNLQEPLLQYRSHGGSITAQKLAPFQIAHKHAIASILHAKNGIKNNDINFDNWTVFDYLHLYYSTFWFGLRSLVSNVIKYKK